METLRAISVPELRKKQKQTKAKMYKMVNTDFSYFARFIAGREKL